MKFDPSQFPVIQLSLRATAEDSDIRKIAEQLETELRRTKGVASVSVSGKLDRRSANHCGSEKTCSEWT